MTLGFMVYLFLTCTRTEKAATSSNIFIRSEPGSSARVTTAAPPAGPATRRVEPKDPDVVYGRGGRGRSNGYCNGTRHGNNHRCV